MLNSGKRASVFSALFMPFALFVLASCNLSNKPKLPKPPFETSIDLAREGVVADFNIWMPLHRIYRFRIHFAYPKEDQAERERVRKLVGDYGRGKDNNLIELGILTPVKLTIFKEQSQSELIIYQRIIKYPETYAYGSGYFAKAIGYCNLPRGEYRFVLESLVQLPEYASIPTTFMINFNSFPKATFIPINIDRSKTCPQ